MNCAITEIREGEFGRGEEVKGEMKGSGNRARVAGFGKIGGVGRKAREKLGTEFAHGVHRKGTIRRQRFEVRLQREKGASGIR